MRGNDISDELLHAALQYRAEIVAAFMVDLDKNTTADLLELGKRIMLIDNKDPMQSLAMLGYYHVVIQFKKRGK